MFHALVEDPHVRRYLMDGQVMPRAWSAERIAESASLFERHGVGLWLARDRASGEAIGFCGFLDVPDTDGPQLVYALPARWTGRGLGTEMAWACVSAARGAGLGEVRASVDAVNAASVRVLERLGFRLESTGVGAFGELHVYRLPADAAPV